MSDQRLAHGRIPLAEFPVAMNGAFPFDRPPAAPNRKNSEPFWNANRPVRSSGGRRPSRGSSAVAERRHRGAGDPDPFSRFHGPSPAELIKLHRGKAETIAKLEALLARAIEEHASLSACVLPEERALRLQAILDQRNQEFAAVKAELQATKRAQARASRALENGDDGTTKLVMLQRSQQNELRVVATNMSRAEADVARANDSLACAEAQLENIAQQIKAADAQLDMEQLRKVKRLMRHKAGQARELEYYAATARKLAAELADAQAEVQYQASAAERAAEEIPQINKAIALQRRRVRDMDVQFKRLKQNHDAAVAKGAPPGGVVKAGGGVGLLNAFEREVGKLVAAHDRGAGGGGDAEARARGRGRAGGAGAGEGAAPSGPSGGRPRPPLPAYYPASAVMPVDDVAAKDLLPMLREPMEQPWRHGARARGRHRSESPASGGDGPRRRFIDAEDEQFMGAGGAVGSLSARNSPSSGWGQQPRHRRRSVRSEGLSEAGDGIVVRQVSDDGEEEPVGRRGKARAALGRVPPPVPPGGPRGASAGRRVSTAGRSDAGSRPVSGLGVGARGRPRSNGSPVEPDWLLRSPDPQAEGEGDELAEVLGGERKKSRGKDGKERSKRSKDKSKRSEKEKGAKDAESVARSAKRKERLEVAAADRAQRAASAVHSAARGPEGGDIDVGGSRPTSRASSRASQRSRVCAGGGGAPAEPLAVVDRKVAPSRDVSPASDQIGAVENPSAPLVATTKSAESSRRASATSRRASGLPTLGGGGKRVAAQDTIVPTSAGGEDEVLGGGDVGGGDVAMAPSRRGSAAVARTSRPGTAASKTSQGPVPSDGGRAGPVVEAAPDGGVASREDHASALDAGAPPQEPLDDPSHAVPAVEEPPVEAPAAAPAPPPMKCPECKGLGTISKRSVFGGMKSSPCPKCSGKGEIGGASAPFDAAAGGAARSGAALVAGGGAKARDSSPTGLGAGVGTVGGKCGACDGHGTVAKRSLLGGLSRAKCVQCAGTGRSNSSPVKQGGPPADLPERAMSRAESRAAARAKSADLPDWLGAAEGKDDGPADINLDL